MELAEKIRQIAYEYGASDVAFCGVSPFERWRDTPGAILPSLEYRPSALMEDARSIVILIFAAPPYVWDESRSRICSYYPRANVVYGLSGKIAEEMQALGLKALPHPNLPLKASAIRSGAASYGKCGLTFHKALGSYVVYGSILTDAPIEANDADEAPSFGNCPEGCLECASACPTSALNGSGLVGESCMRRYMGRDVPENMIAPMGLNLWGCELCQRACPRNAHIAPVPVPEHIHRAFSIERILAREHGVFDEIGEILGRNYARENIILSQALIVAANMGDTSLAPLVMALKNHPSERVARLADIAYMHMA